MRPFLVIEKTRPQGFSSRVWKTKNFFLDKAEVCKMQFKRGLKTVTKRELITEQNKSKKAIISWSSYESRL